MGALVSGDHSGANGGRARLGGGAALVSTTVATAADLIPPRIPDMIGGPTTEVDVDPTVFVAKAAHELRGAVGSLGVLASTLADEVGRRDVDDGLSLLARELAQQSARVELLTRQLLDLSSSRDAHAWGAREPVHVAGVLDAVLRGERPDAARTVSIEVEDDLVIDTDPCALERILANLVRNAYRHGGPSIELRGRVEDDRVVLEVVDDGEGVAVDVRDRLFDPFVRASGGDGHGLGLAIVAELAAALDGEVQYQPNEPSGARFSVILPAG